MTVFEIFIKICGYVKGVLCTNPEKKIIREALLGESVSEIKCCMKWNCLFRTRWI